MTQESVTGHRQRLKQRFLDGEAQALTDEALLELLLTYAIPQKDVQPLARALLSRFGSLAAVLEADLPALCEVRGVAQSTATLLKLANRIHKQLPGRNGAYKQVAPSQLSMGMFEQASLPSESLGDSQHPTTTPEAPASASYKMLPKRGGDLFSQSVLDEAIELLPKLPDTDSLDAAAEFLQRKMRFNSAETRRRYVSYITRRMFSHGTADMALRHFARAFVGRQELRDVCFYRFCKAEPLMFRITDDVLLPAITSGALERRQLRQYLAQRYPDAGNIEDCAKAVVKVLVDGNVARANRTEIQVSYREPLLPSLAFVIHSEFEPGMFDLAQLERNPALRALLWNPDRILPLLYELRNRGWVAKVSEIDSVRQFTVRWTLNEFVLAVTHGGEGSA